MKRFTLTAMMLSSMLGVSALVGCDREVSHKETVRKTSDGTVVKDKTTVTEGADGTVRKDTSHTVDKDPARTP